MVDLQFRQTVVPAIVLTRIHLLAVSTFSSSFCFKHNLFIVEKDWAQLDMRQESSPGKDYIFGSFESTCIHENARAING